jgi:hypothetical protein
MQYTVFAYLGWPHRARYRKLARFSDRTALFSSGRASRIYAVAHPGEAARDGRFRERNAAPGITATVIVASTTVATTLRVTAPVWGLRLLRSCGRPYYKDPVLHPDLYDEWQHRISVASQRYDDAKKRVRETVVERLTLPVPDGDLAHRLALRAETAALREYWDLVASFSKLMLDDAPPR